jgi:hypothetical protein
MDVYRIAVKIFASADDFAPDQFVPIFQRWIQNQAIEGHRLIDVADYGHVVTGPGTVLISSEANFYMDRGEKRLGLLYSRKLPLAGSFQERVRAAVRETLKAAAKLEGEAGVAGKLKFKTDELVIRLNDRLLAPPNEATVTEARGDIDAVTKSLFGEKAKVESHLTPLTVVEFRIRSKENPPLSTLPGKL